MKTTWLTPFGSAWEQKTGAPPNWRRLAQELGIVKDKLTDNGVKEMRAREILLRHWHEYVSRTPAKYLSPTRFRATFNGWDPVTNHRHDVDRRLDAGNRRKEARLADGEREELPAAARRVLREIANQ